MNYGCDSTAHPWLQNWWWNAVDTRIPAPNTAYRRALEDMHREVGRMELKYWGSYKYHDTRTVLVQMRHRIAEMLG